MASSVSFSNVDALLRLRDGLARFGSKADEVVRALEIELRHLLEEWDERVQKARRQERECQSDLSDALRDLRWCQASGDDETPANSSYEQERVEQARRALVKAQARLQLVNRSAREVQMACEAFQKHGRDLRVVAKQTAPDASRHMTILLRDLERYSLVASSGGESGYVSVSGISTGVPLLEQAFNLNELSEEQEPVNAAHQERLSSSMRDLARLLNGRLWPTSPPDATQIQLAGERLGVIPELAPEVWERLPELQRVAALGTIECVMAELQGRPPVPVNVESGESGTYGGYNPQTGHITLNRYFFDLSPREIVDTIIHEGRHAYQAYAMSQRAFHPDQDEVGRWRINNLYYIDPDVWGEEAYFEQPVERDAFAYAQAVIRQLYGDDQ